MTTRIWTMALPATGLVALLAVSASVAGGLGGLLGTGETTYVHVVDASELGVVAGTVTVHTQGPLGPLTGGETVVPGEGWVVLQPEGGRLLGGGPLTVTDELAFTDPNGGDWTTREVTSATGVGWIVPVDAPRYDATLDETYNFAAVVDWDQVPGDGRLTATYHEDVPLQG